MAIPRRAGMKNHGVGGLWWQTGDGVTRLRRQRVSLAGHHHTQGGSGVPLNGEILQGVGLVIRGSQ